MANKHIASRRGFLRESSSLLTGALLAGGATAGVHSHGSGEIRVGLVGCGRRGTTIAGEVLKSSAFTKLVAMADVFGDRLHACLRGLGSRHRAQVDVPKDRQFVGLTAYEHLLAQDVDYVIFATPPGFRPLHFAKAVEAGKHCFLEKPLAVDVPGVRSVLQTYMAAMGQDLTVGVGLQRRHEPRYQQTVERLRAGAVGDIQLLRAYWNGNGATVKPRQRRQSELEYQLRNWYYFTWLGGDHIVEQHIHNLDVMNWVVGQTPIRAQGMGGREVRTGIEHGQIFDHHCVEFTYSHGQTLISQCRQIPGCWNYVGEYVHGTEGWAKVSGGPIAPGRQWPTQNRPPASERSSRGVWRFGQGGGDGQRHQQERLLSSIQGGEAINEAETGAASTLTAIMGRMATYTGQLIDFNDAIADGEALANVASLTSLENPPPVLPDAAGRYPIAQAGT
jgi:myo-inositol 2-dehydrogenase/D-chiro-inositol 1-dehydrogenase